PVIAPSRANCSGACPSKPIQTTSSLITKSWPKRSGRDLRSGRSRAPRATRPMLHPSAFGEASDTDSDVLRLDSVFGWQGGDFGTPGDFPGTLAVHFSCRFARTSARLFRASV